MKTTAMVLGIIGGVYGLPVAFVGMIVLGAFSQSAIVAIATILTPVAGLVGAGMSQTKPLIGASLMGIVGCGMFAAGLAVFGIPAALLFLSGAIVSLISVFVVEKPKS